ncbi:MAG: orotidine-5'-phosphate decarboxylase [Oscillospiraceae bacterium]|nr:orotidine-5'-phosphate decarboxylase [Oscillospiraceae bacterium]
MINITDELIKNIKEKDNPTVMGLDPVFSYIPEGILKNNRIDASNESIEETNINVPEAFLEFNKELIDSVCDVIPAVKPNLAFYEAYGYKGVKAFEDTCTYAKEKGMVVISDGKRNDIGSTAEAYARAYFSNIDNVDMLTVNGYLGEDGINPFVDVSETLGYKKGIFVLVKTSNKSSGQLQDLKLENGNELYLEVASLVNEWNEKTKGENGYGVVGAVVGATYKEQLEILRKAMPSSYILIPGYGAQGGTAEDIAVGFNEDGLGAIVNSSRGLMCAYKKDKYAGQTLKEAARAEAIHMRDDLNSVIKK